MFFRLQSNSIALHQPQKSRGQSAPHHQSVAKISLTSSAKTVLRSALFCSVSLRAATPLHSARSSLRSSKALMSRCARCFRLLCRSPTAQQHISARSLVAATAAEYRTGSSSLAASRQPQQRPLPLLALLLCIAPERALLRQDAALAGYGQCLKGFAPL